MKILIATDSYKGTMSADEVCAAISEGILSTAPNTEIVTLPMADGGEGFADCMSKICKGEKLYTRCQNIYGQAIDGYIIECGEFAIVECAVASGLLAKKNVMQASSYGTGELIKHAKTLGYDHIILGLGGSGCCDGGIGALSALGGIFYDENQNIISRPKSNDMNFVFGMNMKNIVKGIHFTYACDVENEYYGKNGAAYVFAPQKGARKTDVEELDEGLKRMDAFFGTDLGKVKGSGAAGGLCGGLYAIYGGEIKSGFDILSEVSGLEDKIKECDIVITGEGRTDEQTLMGKLPYKIAQLAKKHNKKCVVISGSIEGVTIGDKMISLVDEVTDVATAMADGHKILVEKSKSVLQ